MADLTLRLVKGTELTFGELDANFLSLDSDIISLQSQVDSLAVAAGLDSARAIAIIDQVVDSAYVKLHYEQEDIFRDSAFITNIADSQIRFVVDSQYVTDRVDITQLGLLDSEKVVRIIDSYVDSEYIYRHVDSDYIKFIADSDYIHSAADSDWIKFIADSNYVKSAADSEWIKHVADSAYLTGIIDSDYVISITGIDSERVISLMESDARHILPSAPEAFDLGSNLRRWRAIYTKDLFVSPATIYFGVGDSPQRSRISLDSDGEFQLTSPTQTGFIATSSTGNAIDSNTVLSLIDSSYVQARTLFDRFDDSSDIRSMIDSAYIQSRQIVGGSPWDSAKTTSIIDSAYVRDRVGPGVQIAGGRFNYSSTFSYDSAGETPGRYVKSQFGINNMVRNQAGRYTITFDSANQTLLDDSYSYIVMAIVDYKGDDPTASTRSVTVNTQSANSFDLVTERTDTGDDGDYSDAAFINFMVFKS